MCAAPGQDTGIGETDSPGGKQAGGRVTKETFGFFFRRFLLLFFIFGTLAWHMLQLCVRQAAG